MSLIPHLDLMGSSRWERWSFPLETDVIQSIVSALSSSSLFSDLDEDEDAEEMREQGCDVSRDAAAGAIADRRGSVCQLQVCKSTAV